MDDPAKFLARLQGAARRVETPSGEGSMVWHLWGDPAAPPLVLLHGGNGSWRHWARNVETLSRDNHLLVADLPGLGESAMPPGPADPASVAAVVAEGIDRLLGVDTRYDLAGFSFGAVCSGHVAAIRLGRLRSVTIIGAGSLGLERSETPLVKVRSKQGEERLDAHRQNLASLMLADPAKIDALALLIQDWNTEHARFRSRGFASTARLREALERSDAPLGAIYGERDAIAYPHLDLRRDVVRAIQPDAEFRLIPGAGHWVAYEAPEAFEAALRAILARRRAEAA